MKLIKLNAIDSTNTYLIELSKEVALKDGTIVVAKEQNKGRGQVGAYWQSTTQQSLTCSVFKKFNDLALDKISYLSFAVSIGLKKGLLKYKIPNLSIKWPNDIMSHSKKMAGILIENQVKQKKVISSVIGIGLNVNEGGFDNLPQATSMFLTTKKSYDLDEVMQCIFESVLIELNRIKEKDFESLKLNYETELFRKDIISVYQDLQGDRFNGIIKGVSDIGELQIEKEDGILQNYKFKEIKMLL